MRNLTRNVRRLALAVGAGAALLASAMPAQAQSGDQGGVNNQVQHP